MNPENSTQIYHHPIPHTWIFYHEFHQEKSILDDIEVLFHNQDNIVVGILNGVH